jgi:ribosomal protein S27AE
MHEERLECPRCRGTLQLGFLLEGGEGEMRRVTQWVQGKPERNFWVGLSIKDRAVLAVTTYRCERCGYLESYAVAEA